MVTRKKKSTTIIEEDIPMVKFTCVSCGKENFDMGHYFHDKPSTKCLWCTKYPKVIKKKEISYEQGRGQTEALEAPATKRKQDKKPVEDSKAKQRTKPGRKSTTPDVKT